MANGYTYKVVDGEITKLKDFIAVFTDQSEFLITNQENLRYHSEELTNVLDNLLQFEKQYQTDDQKISYGKQRQSDAILELETNKQKQKQKAQNLFNMKSLVAYWKVSDTIQPLKNRMMDELDKSIDFDLGNGSFVALYDSQIQDIKSENNIFHYYESTVASYHRRVNYHLEQLHSALEEKKKYDQYQKELKKSLENI